MSQLDFVFDRAEALGLPPLPRRLICFLGVGLVGLAVHTGLFALVFHVLGFKKVAWFVGLACATCATWMLNRTFTFAGTGRRTHSEAIRYIVVTAVAQSFSFGIFSLVLRTLPAVPPAAAVVVGAVAATIVSYTGQRFFTFAPSKRAAQ